MNYGYFDIENREYVITRPDTPTPWMNYLGSGGFGGLISNNGGGLLFDGDPGKKRITRYRYNNLPMDRPGRYLYIKDMQSGEYWSPTWQPVMKELDFYECRHGLSYTVIKSRYNGVETEIKYFIPEGKSYEVWSGCIKNTSGEKLNLKLFPYMEFSYHNANIDIMQEWARYEMTGSIKENIIVCDCETEILKGKPFFSFMNTDMEKEGFDCSREKFIGRYRNEEKPIAVENGQCSNSQINADQLCAAFACPMSLEPGEEKEFIVTVGVAYGRDNIVKTATESIDRAEAEKALENLKNKWAEYLEHCQIQTPDPDMNKMINIWNAYQARTTYNWSRYISYYERGSDRGWGFRDSMQDVLGVMHAIPSMARERIETLLKIQCSDGNAKNVYFPGTGEAAGGGRSDDHLWSVYSVCAYIKETGDYEFLDKKIPYYDEGEGTVKEHLIRGLEFTRNNTGEHNIPKFLKSDWNDSISAIGKGGKSESAFVFFQAAKAAKDLKELFEHISDNENYQWASEYYEWCRKEYPQLWDGKWFIRAYTNEGEKLGTDEDEYNKIFLNPQSWAVLSGLPSEEESNTAFDNVYKYLFSDMGCISHYPASSGYNPENKTYFTIRSGIKENGGVFCHANTWAVIAETMLNRNDEAYKLYKSTIPCSRNDIADITLMEPYVYGSALLGPAHERYGAGSNSWLTGTASWMYFAVTQYILGFRPEYDGILIDPCIPTDWDGFSMTRKYRGIKCNVTVKACVGKTKVSRLIVDGVEVDGNYIPYEMIKGKESIDIIAEF